MEEYKNKIKLGAFVLGGLLLFLSALFYLGRENNFFSKTFTISAVFKNVEGLNSGDNVWLSGVKIGTVKNVSVVADGKVIVQLALKEKQNQFIRKDATASVGSDGLVGNKIVVIRSGTSNQLIQDNDTINSVSPTDTQELFNIAKEVGLNTRQITADLKLITEKLNNGEGILGELMNDGKISQDIRASVALLRTTGTNTLEASKQVNTMLTQINEGDGLITHLLTDSSYTNTFEKALADISVMGTRAKEMSVDLQHLTAQLKNENNVIQVLLADSSAANDLKKSLDQANSASEKLDENMTAMRSNFLLRKYFKKKEKAEGSDL